MSIAPTPYLTAGYAPELELQISKTRPGMAHFADTGPCGTTCGECAYFGEIPTHLVSPRKWKSHFGLDADKEKSRALAIRLWPGCGLFERKKDHGRSEAALLARYGTEVIERWSQ